MSDVDIRIKLHGADATERQLATLGARMKKIGDSAARAIGRTVERAAIPTALAIGGMLKVAADFELGMNQVKAVSGATGEQFEQLKKQAMDLGKSTQFTASQAAEGMNFLAKAGFNATEILSAMPGTLQLAASAQLDLGSAADIVSNILQGYGLQVSELGHANDVLVKAFTSSNTNLVQLGEAMKYVGPVATSMGQDFESVVAMLGKLGDAGIQASMAGTTLRGALARLANPSKKASDILDELGVAVFDAQGKMRPLVDIIEDLDKAGMSSADAMELFGQRAGPGMLALIGGGIDGIRDLTAELKDAGGTAEKIADVQMQGLTGAMREIKSALEGLAIAAGDSGLLDFASAVVHGFTIMVRGIGQLPPSFTGALGEIMKTVLDFILFLDKQLVERIRDYIVEGVRENLDKITGFFRDMYNEVVGHSIVPDMVNLIGQNFSQLNDVMVKPTQQAVSNVLYGFNSMGAGIQAVFNKITNSMLASFKGLGGSGGIGISSGTSFGTGLAGAVLGTAGSFLGGGGINAGFATGIPAMSGSGLAGAINAPQFLASVAAGNIGGLAMNTGSLIGNNGGILAGIGQIGSMLGLGDFGLGSAFSTLSGGQALGGGSLGSLFSGISGVTGLFSALGSPSLATLGFNLAGMLGLGDLGTAALSSAFGFSPAGAVGSLLANLLGLGGGGLAGGLLGTAGGLAGGAIGASFASLGALGGPIGALAGGFLGTLLGGLFGGGNPNVTAKWNSNLTGTDLSRGGVKTSASGKVWDAVKQVAEAVSGALNQVAVMLGTTLNDQVYFQLTGNTQQGDQNFLLRYSGIAGDSNPGGKRNKQFKMPLSDPDAFAQAVVSFLLKQPNTFPDLAPLVSQTLISGLSAGDLDAAVQQAAYIKDIYRLQTGGSIIASRPSLFLAGEHGHPERIDVTPLSGRRGGSQGIQFNISGPLVINEIGMLRWTREIEKRINMSRSRYFG